MGIYEGHAFLIKDINKLAKLYACVNCQARFAKNCIYKDTQKSVHKGERSSSVQTTE